MFTLTDMFCGAGGSSTGASMLPNITISTALNHWPVAIETHGTNHPETRHVLADISQVDPRYIEPTDILWASPECTNHTSAKGVKRTQGPSLFDLSKTEQAAERSRATMWDVPRFAEYHNYRLIITENVVEAARWILFDAWLNAMHALGYQHQVIYLNSMHASLMGDPAPQSRDRMYVMFWKGITRPDFDLLRPVAECPEHGMVRSVQAFKNPVNPWGRYRSQYVYRCPRPECGYRVVEPVTLPAGDCIDWTNTGTVIEERPTPLRPATLQRLKTGVEVNQGLDRLIVSHQSGSDRTRSYSDRQPFKTIVAGGGHTAILHNPDSETSWSRWRHRMCTPRELANGMAFPAGYSFTGTTSDQIKQAGNAVTPPVARDLLAVGTGIAA